MFRGKYQHEFSSPIEEEEKRGAILIWNTRTQKYSTSMKRNSRTDTTLLAIFDSPGISKRDYVCVQLGYGSPSCLCRSTQQKPTTT